MFEDFYGFSSPPFRLTPDRRFFYSSEGHRKAMSYLNYGIYQGEGFIVITGDVGTGKSMLVSQLMSEIDQHEVIAATIGTTQIDAEDAVRMIVSAFNIPAQNRDKAALLLALESFLNEQHLANRRVLLVVDEAQNLPMRTLEELRMLSNFNINGHSLFQCFLIGQPQFLNLLTNPDLAQLQQRVIASYQLEPINLEETREYILHRLRLAGWSGRPEFTDDAIRNIYRETGGVPRKINSLCNRALMYGALEELQNIDSDAVAEVVRDLKKEVHAAVAQTGSTSPPLYPAAPSSAPVSASEEARLRGSVAGANPGSATPSLAQIELNLRLARIETALTKHDSALSKLIDTTVRYLSVWQNETKPGQKDADSPADKPVLASVSSLATKRTVS